MKKQNIAFTLVELIVVITILSVLATIWFVSLTWYSQEAKDATKTADLVNIWRWIWIGVLSWKSFNTSKLTDVSYAHHPAPLTVKIWELTQWVVPWLSDTPVDPYTWKPYIIGIHENNQGIVTYGQVWWILENRKGEITKLWTNDKFPSFVPVQRIVWNYKPNDFVWVSWLIPRWAIEDYQWFQNTDFYQSWEIMYWSSWYWVNAYLYAMNNTPVVQINNYTDENTILYESFENISLENTWYSRVLNRTMTSSQYPGWERVYDNEQIFVPTCISKNTSVGLSYEFNSTYYDQVRTVECDLPNDGVNSQSALKLTWLRDWVGWDGQYNYIILDPTKQYEMSLDVKWSLSDYSWNLPLYFGCYLRNPQWVRSTISSLSFQFPLDASNFQRVTAYVNAPDPSWNGLSININPTGLEWTVSCIFYRWNTAKAWDELYFDNYIVREIN